MSDGVLCQEEDGEAFLLHVATGRYFGLNPSGLVVWKALAAGDDPVEALRRQWPAVRVEACRADAERLMASLVEAGLIETASRAGGD